MQILVYKRNKELLFKFESAVIPSHGEILHKDNKNYFVSRVIRIVPTTEMETEYFILEVEEYISESVFYDNV